MKTDAVIAELRELKAEQRKTNAFLQQLVGRQSVPRLVYTTAQVAEALGVSVESVYGLLRQDLLHSVRLGVEHRIPADELVRFVQSGQDVARVRGKASDVNGRLADTDADRDRGSENTSASHALHRGSGADSSVAVGAVPHKVRS